MENAENQYTVRAQQGKGAGKLVRCHQEDSVILTLELAFKIIGQNAALRFTAVLALSDKQKSNIAKDQYGTAQLLFLYSVSGTQ